MAELTDTNIRESVRERYAAAARTAESGCCGDRQLSGDASSGDCGGSLYSEEDAEGATDAAVAASLGCGVPTAVAELHDGETVLDLGSGAGADVLISARRVAPGGKAIGLDMTDEMLDLARRNAADAGVTNVEFLKGYIEQIPLPDNSVDVIISNCVINLSSDKDAVLREAFRVLKPGGRFAVSDVVVRGEVPADIRRSVELWVGCIAGALEESEYATKLRAAGFTNVEVEPWRVYKVDDARVFLTEHGVDVDRVAPQVEGKFASAFVRARKPAAKNCCGPECCA
jgi:arsenite methyltransferase